MYSMRKGGTCMRGTCMRKGGTCMRVHVRERGYMYEEGGYMYEGYMYGKGGIRKMYWLHVRTRESLLKQYTGMCPHWLVVVVSTNHL